MKKENVIIGKVKLIDGGVSGIKVEYLEKEVRGNRVYLNRYPGVRKKAPVHEDLINAFWPLRAYMAKILGFSVEAIADIDVNEVSYDGEGFVLKGTKKICDGEGLAPLNTKKLTAGTVDDGDKVIEYVERIFEEVKEYMDNGKTMGDGQLMMRLYASKGDFDGEAFEDLPEDQKTELATKWLEKNGAIVCLADEATVGGPSAQVVGFEEKVKERDKVLGKEQGVSKEALEVLAEKALSTKVSAEVLGQEVWTEELGAIPANNAVADNIFEVQVEVVAEKVLNEKGVTVDKEIEDFIMGEDEVLVAPVDGSTAKKLVKGKGLQAEAQEVSVVEEEDEDIDLFK